MFKERKKMFNGLIKKLLRTYFVQLENIYNLKKNYKPFKSILR